MASGRELSAQLTSHQRRPNSKKRTAGHMQLRSKITTTDKHNGEINERAGATQVDWYNGIDNDIVRIFSV